MTSASAALRRFKPHVNKFIIWNMRLLRVEETSKAMSAPLYGGRSPIEQAVFQRCKPTDAIRSPDLVVGKPDVRGLCYGSSTRESPLNSGFIPWCIGAAPEAGHDQDAIADLSGLSLPINQFNITERKFPMKTEKLVRFALKQAGIMAAVITAIPVIGIVTQILLSAIANLFCEQLNSLMILTVVITASVLAAKQLRGDISKL